MGSNEKVKSNKLFCTLKISKGLIEYVQKKIKFFLSQSWQMQGLQAGGIMPYPYQQGNPGAEASVGVKLVTEPIQGSEQPIEVVKQELSEPEENEFLDYSFGV